MASEALSPIDIVKSALDHLNRHVWRLTAVSRLYESKAFPRGSGPDFCNAAASFLSDDQADDILAKLHGVEELFQRQRRVRWGPRTLDLDLIAIGQTVLPNPEEFCRWQGLAPDQQTRQTPNTLILPHPRLQDRPFVLKPMMEICPGWCHPVLGQTLAELLDDLSDEEKDGTKPI
jgi:2-amino-4-hydroxy-6-hydroxymethyldihydropteridine diphosphokinase